MTQQLCCWEDSNNFKKMYDSSKARSTWGNRRRHGRLDSVSAPTPAGKNEESKCLSLGTNLVSLGMAPRRLAALTEQHTLGVFILFRRLVALSYSAGQQESVHTDSEDTADIGKERFRSLNIHIISCKFMKPGL